MSSFQAIGAVSATLQRLLRDRMELPASAPSVDVTITSPQRASQEPFSIEDPRVNLFLYQVTENGSLKNQEIVGHGHPGAYGHPPLSLDLHYLLTAYGSTSEEPYVNESQAQHLLGSAMRVLHDYSIITEQLQDAQNQPVLDEALRNQYEHVKLSLDPLSLEDLSKVWTALNLPFRLSAAYTVSVVQIESQRQRRISPPVETRRVHVAQLRRPQITKLYRTPASGEPIGDLRIKIGDSITIEGRNFAAAATWVTLGDVDPISVTPLSDERIELLAPDDPLLWPGPQSGEVRTQVSTEVVEGGLDKGEVVTDQGVQQSNRTVFMLVPEISSVSASPSFDLLTVQGGRLYRGDLKSIVLVGDLAIAVRPPGQQDNWVAPTAASVQVPLPSLAPGTYAVRIRVNGAESTEDQSVVVA